MHVFYKDFKMQHKKTKGRYPEPLLSTSKQTVLFFYKLSYICAILYILIRQTMTKKRLEKTHINFCAECSADHIFCNNRSFILRNGFSTRYRSNIAPRMATARHKNIIGILSFCTPSFANNSCVTWNKPLCERYIE